MPDVLTNILESGGWFSTILDFVIVYYLIYVTLLLIRGTRTVSMAIGLLVIVVLYLLSQSLRLATTYMLLDQFMEVAVIFGLIIFQDDIRRALVRMGRFAWFLKAKESQVVEEVVRAATSLAGKQLGAIIVFERDASLSDFIEKGTELDATVSRELLYTIFIPRMENPLHDGAVIIKNLRIREAGALLPLSGNPKLGKVFGTRHRAALGITEETDAVSIVVSEERGTMSLCFDGRMSKNLDGDSLRRALYGLFSEEKNRERRKAAEERKSRTTKPPTPLPALEVTGEVDPLSPVEEVVPPETAEREFREGQSSEEASPGTNSSEKDRQKSRTSDASKDEPVVRGNE
jgi:diadenylate cyclase